MTYTASAVGFAFFTSVGFCDLKETRALLVAQLCGVAVYMWLIKRLRGRAAAWRASVGLLVMTFAFLGLNMFLSGLHAYGEL